MDVWRKKREKKKIFFPLLEYTSTLVVGWNSKELQYTNWQTESKRERERERERSTFGCLHVHSVSIFSLHVSVSVCLFDFLSLFYTRKFVNHISLIHLKLLLFLKLEWITILQFKCQKLVQKLWEKLYMCLSM